MTVIRRLIAHRHVAALLCAAALLLKLLVPTGYMIGDVGGRATIELCSGMAPGATATAMAMPGMHGDPSGHGDGSGPEDGHHGKPDAPCPFLGLSAAALDTIDPILIAALIAFIMATGRPPARRVSVPRRGHLRPPLRGPPARS